MGLFGKKDTTGLTKYEALLENASMYDFYKKKQHPTLSVGCCFNSNLHIERFAMQIPY